MKKEISLGIILALVLVLFHKSEGNLLLLVLLFLGGCYFFNNRQRSFTAVNDTISFADIGGQEVAKRELKEALDFILQKEKIKEMGIRPLKGVLLTGPPGTGKTLLARAAANFTDSAFLAVSGSEFVEMYAGVGAKRIRELFKKARTEKKNGTVIFIDEIDVLGSARGNNHGHMEYEQTLNQLLTEMDGLQEKEGDSGILVIAATNRSDILDEALLRPGRFDRIVNVDLPDKKGRKAILELYLKKKPVDEAVDLDFLAQETFGFSGAHLESLVNEAAILAMRSGGSLIQREHLKEAVDKVILGEKLERKPNEEELRRIAIHETGHAFLAEYGSPDSVAALTIASRGKALGFVRQKSEDDIYLHTQEYLEQQIAVALAGSCAEQLFLGSRSTGASSDFQQAAKLSRQLIASGMSSLGVVSLDDLPENMLHQEICAVLGEQEKKIMALLEEKRALFENLVDTVLEKESLSGEELRLIFRENGLS